MKECLEVRIPGNRLEKGLRNTDKAVRPIFKDVPLICTVKRCK